MAINTNIYGTSDQWLNCYYQPNTIVANERNKKANFGNNNATLGQGVSSGKLSYSEPIDKSLSYCGLGTESALSHIAYLKNGASDINSYQDRFVTNFAFFERTSNSFFIYPVSYKLTNLNEYAWQSSQLSYANLHPSIEPYTKVNPKNIVLVLYVVAYNTSYTAEVRKPLKEYLTSYTVSHPYISSVYIVPYFGRVNSGADTRTVYTQTDYKIPFIIGLLDEYDFTTENKKFYMYSSENLSIFGQFHSNYEIPSDSYGIIAHTENSKQHFKISQSGSITRFAIEYYPEFESDILKTAACFGLYFTTVAEVARTGLLTNPDMYIGLLDENGIGHGEYLRGSDTANAPQNNYTDMTQSGYDYTKDVDKTKYRNDTQFYAGYGTSSFTKFYALTETQVNELSQELYRIANDVPSGTSITEYNMKMFLTNNPIDCIISLKKFPVDNIPLATTDATIYLGAKSTNITGKILVTPTWVYYFNFRNSANQSCRPIFGDNFLDYEPYTKCKIVIPFCGTVDVPVSYIYQYDDLQIALVMDFITGAVTAFILVNGITIDSITGSCAIDLPVSGIQSATLDSQIHSVAMAREKQQTTLGTGLIAGAVSIGIGLATGSLPVAIGGGAAIIGSFMHAEDTGKQINYDLTHMQTPVKQVSAASGQIAHTYDMRCKMVITRPEIAAEYSAEEYSKTIGFACLENGEVQNFHGLTLANIDLSGINCTAEEKNMIRAAFANGVYLPAEYSENYWT